MGCNFVGALAAGFDLQKMAMKIFEIVVHLLEIGSALFFSFNRRSMSGDKLFVVSFEERFDAR